jgi:hypothetical protein
MKYFIQTVFALVLMLAPSADANPTARRQFLFNLGFNDISMEFRTRLKNGQYQHALNRRQMEANVIAYEAVNAARELSIFMLEEIGFDENQVNSKKAKALSLFAARMIALKPNPSPIDFPSAILSIKNEEAQIKAVVDWLHDQRVIRMNEHKARLLSDVVHLTYGNQIDSKKTQIRRMDQLLNTLIERMYLDDTTGSNAYFGRALTALLLRDEILAHDGSPIKNWIQDELLHHYGRRLENYFGDQLNIDTPAGLEKVKIVDGSIGLTRIPQMGSFMISVATIPKNIIARWKARFKGLVGNPIAPFFFTGNATEDSRLDIWERIRDWISHGGIVSKGFSHIVYYQIMQDPETGIIMPRIIDNYPSHLADDTSIYVRTGGTRFTYPEQVVDMSHHSAVYVGTPNPQKLSDWAQEYVKSHGYQKSFFPSSQVELKDGSVLQKNNQLVEWQTTISHDEFQKIHSESNRLKHGNEILKRIAQGLEQSVYEGWVFHWPESYGFYIECATYCSQLEEVVSRKFVGIPAEQTKSTWHWLLKALAAVGTWAENRPHDSYLKGLGQKIVDIEFVKKAMRLTKIDIFAPSSIATQPYMTGKAYRLPPKTFEQRAHGKFSSGQYIESNSKLTDRLVSELNLTQMGQSSRNFSLDYSAALSELDRIKILRASFGMPPVYIDEEEVSAQGTEREIQRLGLKQECIEVLSGN